MTVANSHMLLILFLYCYFRVIQLMELSCSFQIAISDLVEEVSQVIRRFLDTWWTSKELEMVTFYTHVQLLKAELAKTEK